MNKALFLLPFFLVQSVFSADLQPISAKALKDAGQSLPNPSAKIVTRHIWMSVRNNPSWKEVEANDYAERIEARVRMSFKDSFDVTLRADSQTSWGDIRKNGNYYTFSASGIYLNMSKTGDSYFINGNINENGKTSFISVTMSRRFDDYSFSLFGSGINLYTDEHSINGNYDAESYSKKAVAAVVSMCLAVQAEKGQPKPETKTASQGQRVWFTFRPGFGAFSDMEASEPWLKSEVKIRKVFDKDFDVEINIDNNRQFGRISNFFSDRIELRASRTDLRLEEWAGQFEIKGSVETPSSENGEKYISLRADKRFNDDASFYIYDKGIRLNIDKNSVYGEADLKTYPREALAAITSLFMAYQQLHPQNPK